MRIVSEAEFDDFIKAIFEEELPAEEKSELFQYYLEIAKEFEESVKRLNSSRDPPLSFECS